MKNILRKSISAAALIMAWSTAVHAQGTISTIAGSGSSGFSGDGGPAISATFSNPCGVAVDGSGNVYVADEYNGRIRKIDASGHISTFAGGGTSYDYGISPTDGHIWMPTNVFINSSSDVLITDHFHDMTFVVNHGSGLLYSRCGCHTQGCDGDGGDATLAKMELPSASCEDGAGNTYIADQGCGKVRKVNGTTGVVTTLATVSGPSAVFFDPTTTTDLYVAEMYNYRVIKINVATGVTTVVAGTGVMGYSGDAGYATSAKLGMPSALFIDHSHNLYICDQTYSVVRKVKLGSGVIYTIAGTGVAGYSGDGNMSQLAQLNNPMGIWVDNSNNVYIADAGNNVIRKIKPKGSKVNGTALDASEITIAPNPSSNGLFSVATDEALSNTSFTVYNLVGAVVATGQFNGNSNIVDLNGKAPGMYTLVFQTSTGLHTEKLSLQ